MRPGVTGRRLPEDVVQTSLFPLSVASPLLDLFVQAGVYSFGYLLRLVVSESYFLLSFGALAFVLTAESDAAASPS